jgi:2-keto-4-pentenoate hydratase
MTLRCNYEVVGAGRGDACLGDPLKALAWLARTSHARGRVLRAGEIVLSGALSAPVGVRAGDLVEARLGGLGEVSVRFS